MESRQPSGLFPSGMQRPVYREPLPVCLPAIFAGAGLAFLWFLLCGVLAATVRGYLWLTVAASVASWSCAVTLARFGDRGAAAGVAIATALAVAVAFVVMLGRWVFDGLPLW